MPYFGRDWRDPGCVWMKVGCSRWEAKEKNVGVMLDSIPRNHVKKIIEAFLHQMQQKKSRSMYTNLTSAPVSKCSVREEMIWLQVDCKSSKEIHGYTTLGEMIRRLDLAGAAIIPYRFPYILEIADLLVSKKMANLSGTAQSHLFQLIGVLLHQVLETKREIRKMKQILSRLMTILQRQSKKSLFSSKIYWFNCVDQVRKWQRDLNLLSFTPRIDNRISLPDLPVEIQRHIVQGLNEYDDINSVSRVNRMLRSIADETSTWRKLCHKNYTEEQIFAATTILQNKVVRQTKEKRKFGLPLTSDLHHNYDNPSTTEEWKNIHSWLRRTYDKREFDFIDPLLFCKRCHVLYWQDSGHPCISDVQNITPQIERLSPSRVISFFE